MPGDERALAFLRQPVLGQLRIDLLDLVAVEGLPEDHVGPEAELVVDALAGRVRNLNDLLPEGGVGWVAGLELRELGPGGVLTGMAKRTLENARTISVATPDELDKLIEWVNAGKNAAVVAHQGEHLFATERVVVSPVAGVFSPVGGLGDGSRIGVGTVLGTISGEEVRSPFAGILQAYIAVEGERVTKRQPVAWLRTA